MAKGQKKKVFISYFNRNEEDANRLFWILYNENLSPWLDWFDLSGAKDWDEYIEKAIKNTIVFISLLTPEVADHFKTLISEDSTEEEKKNAQRYYQTEIKWAKHYGKPIIYLAVNGYTFEEDYHKFLIGTIDTKDAIILHVNLKYDDNALDKMFKMIKEMTEKYEK